MLQSMRGREEVVYSGALEIAKSSGSTRPGHGCEYQRAPSKLPRESKFCDHQESGIQPQASSEREMKKGNLGRKCNH